MKLPAFQFYPGDWQKDPNLRRCSHAAKGVWIDILCLMFESEERGVLITAGRVWSDEEVALAVGGDQAVTLACIQELTLKGVANRRNDGALYSRRLVRDEHKRMLCIEAGKRGGNPKLKQTLKGDSKGHSNGQVNGLPKRNPTPSSSSSSSSSDKEEVEQGLLLPSEAMSLEFPQNLRTAAFFKEWEAWVKFRKTTKKVKDWHSMFQKQLEWLGGFPEATAIAILNQSTMNAWQGLRPIDARNGTKVIPPNPRNNGITNDLSKQGQLIAAAVAAQAKARMK